MNKDKSKQIQEPEIKSEDTGFLMGDMAVLGQLLNQHYQLKGYQDRDDYQTKRGS